MSLPLPRRIAQAALLLGAAAAPLAGAGAAHATALPAADHVVGTLSATRVPAAREAAGQAADAAGQALGGAAESAGGALPGTETLPNAGALPLAAALPTFGVLTDRLPMRGLPVG